MKDNKLIAEFMGIECGDYITPHYHCNWNVMNVVKKCRLESRCKYDTDDAWDKIHWALEEVNEEEIYKAVVEFIKQLNKES